MYDISNDLGNLLQNKMQKVQQHNLLKLLSQQQDQALANDSLSLKLGDLLQGNQQNAVNQAVGRTPIQLPKFSQAPTRAQQTPVLAPQVAAPIMAPKQRSPSVVPPPVDESVIDKRHRLALEKEERKATLAREKEEREHKNKVQLQIDKETLPFYKKIKSISAIIPEVDARLDEMEELLNTGRVQWFGFLDSLSSAPYIGPFAGAIEQAMSTNESQVFKKLSTDFLRDAKPYFGANISTQEVKLFLQRVPSLMLSNEGNRALIRNFRALNRYSEDVDAILEGIIAENGGERPRHLESKLQARLKPATEKLKKSFRDSVKLIPKPAPQKKIRPAVAGGRP